MSEVLSDGQLVGQGHHSHRLKRTKWASPFTPGHDVPLVMENLGSSLQELQGVTLVCDCQHGGLCEADMLAGMVFDALRPNEPQPLARVVLTSKTSAPHRQVRLLGRMAAGLTIPAHAWSLSQEEVIQCFRKLYPPDWFEGFKFPMVEDLANDSVFMDYFQWRQEQSLAWDGPLGPLEATRQVRLRQRMAEGQQAGALSHKAALPQSFHMA